VNKKRAMQSPSHCLWSCGTWTKADGKSLSHCLWSVHGGKRAMVD